MRIYTRVLHMGFSEFLLVHLSMQTRVTLFFPFSHKFQRKREELVLISKTIVARYSLQCGGIKEGCQ